MGKEISQEQDLGLTFIRWVVTQKRWIASVLIVVACSLFFVSWKMVAIRSINCVIGNKTFVVQAEGIGPELKSNLQREVLYKLYPFKHRTQKDIDYVQNNLQVEDLGKTSCMNNFIKELLIYVSVFFLILLVPLFLTTHYELRDLPAIKRPR